MKTPCFSLCSDHRPPRPPKRFHPPSEQHEYQTTKRPVDWADDDNDDSNDNDDRDDDDDDADDDDDDDHISEAGEAWWQLATSGAMNPTWSE